MGAQEPTGGILRGQGTQFPDRRRLLWVCAAGAAVSLAASWLTCSDALTDWDSWDYAGLAVVRQPSHLCLQRWWFIAILRGAWQIGAATGVDLLHAYMPMQIAVSLLSAGAVAALIYWVARFTGSLAAGAMAGLIALVSPTLVAYSSAVMTEGPSLLFLVLAMIGWEAAIRPADPGGEPLQIRPTMRAALAGMAFGVAVNMREPNVLLCAWPAVSCFVDRPARRWTLLTAAAAGAVLTLSFGVLMAWLWHPDMNPWEVLQGYNRYMREERATRGFNGLANVAYLLVHTATAAPLGLFFVGIALVRRVRLRSRQTASRSRDAGSGLPLGGEAQDTSPNGATGSEDRPIAFLPFRRAAWLAASTLPLAAFTWYNPNLPSNWRLLLPSVWMLLPAVGLLAVKVMAAAGRRWRRPGLRGPRLAAPLLAVCCLAVASAGFLTRFRWHQTYARDQSELFQSLLALPDHAVVVPGPASTEAQYLQKLGLRPHWVVFHTETAWTGEILRGRIAREMAAGRRAFLYYPETGWRRSSDTDLDANPEWRSVRFVLEWFRVRPADGSYLELLPPSAIATSVATAPSS